LTLHDLVVFGVGFGCGAIWLGCAFVTGRRLRHCQPPEAFELHREEGVHQSARDRDPQHTTPAKLNLRRILLWALVTEEYAIVALVMLRQGWGH